MFSWCFQLKSLERCQALTLALALKKIFWRLALKKSVGAASKLETNQCHGAGSGAEAWRCVRQDTGAKALRGEPQDFW